MNTKHFSISSIFVFLLLFLISCTSEDSFLICGDSEYDCDYQHRIPGIVTITKGSSRKHYILTEKGLEKAVIKESEPIAFDPESGIALVKELTDSSIEIFTVNARSGKKISSEIVLKPERIEGKDGEQILSIPTLLSSCVQNDGTVILLLNYENLPVIGNEYSEAAGETLDFLYVYEKGEMKNLKKYVFPQDENSEKEFEEAGVPIFEEPREIQCIGKSVYVFSEKTYGNMEEFFGKYYPQPNWLLSMVNLDMKKEGALLENIALIAYDDIRFNRYFEKEKLVYTLTHSSENDAADLLRVLKLNEGYEIVEEPFKKGDGEFLFSETAEGKPLIFFVKTREGVEEQRLDLLTLGF